MKRLVVVLILFVGNLCSAQSISGINNSGSLATSGYAHAVGEIYVVPVNPDNAGSGTIGVASQVIFGTLGTDDVVIAKGVTYYPNPVEDYMKIDLGENYNFSRIEIYDTKGVKINFKTSNTNVIDMNGFSSGIYFVTFPGTKIEPIKIIKK